jgi:hypothetical protein
MRPDTPANLPILSVARRSTFPGGEIFASGRFLLAFQGGEHPLLRRRNLCRSRCLRDREHLAVGRKSSRIANLTPTLAEAGEKHWLRCFSDIAPLKYASNS